MVKKMGSLCTLVIRLAVMTVLAGAAELLVPDGTLRVTVSTAIGLAFVSTAAMEITRIFEGLGV